MNLYTTQKTGDITFEVEMFFIDLGIKRNIHNYLKKLSGAKEETLHPQTKKFV